MATFPAILFRDLKGVSYVWYGTCGSQKNWHMHKEDVNGLLMQSRALANSINQVNQDIGGMLYQPPPRLAALSTVLRAIAQPLRSVCRTKLYARQCLMGI